MVWLYSDFSPAERRDLMFYVGGIMLYKLGLESFNGSIVTLATDRFNANNTFSKLAALTGLNQAMQVVGSILIAPLIKRFPTKSVLSMAIVVFGCITTLFLIIDAGTGGKPRNMNNNKIKYGTWNVNALFPLYMISGVAYGMVELIRRVIPRDIVGGDVTKLRKMDAVVHILYEVAGTAGALLSVFMIKKFGNNYSFVITPPLFTVAGLCWWFVGTLGHQSPTESARLQDVENADKSYASSLVIGFKAFARSTYKGGAIVFSSRKFIWLLPAYSFALYGHRYLENGIAPAIAKRVMLDSSYSQIMVAGSNLGELIGAAMVLVFTNYIKTPLPFLRFDALALLIIWYIPRYTKQVQPHAVLYAWKIAFSWIPISMGWAAGDVSLAAFVQASLARIESQDKEVSALGAVMAFLFSAYIIIYAVLGSLLGKYIDLVFKKDKNIYRALVNIGGVQFTVLSAIVIAATFIPKGAFALNPDIINDAQLEGEIDEEMVVDVLDKTGKQVRERNSDDDKQYESPMKTTDVGAML